MIPFPQPGEVALPQLTFHGAAKTVTGSRTLLESGDERHVVDCGLFQGLRSLRELNWRQPKPDPASVASVLLTHAHIDHSGYLPRFVSHGFNGRIFATPATLELLELLLYDSAKIHEEDARWYNKKGLSKHKPALPLYDSEAVERTLPLCEARPYDEWFRVSKRVRARFINVGHILGSAMVEVEADGQRILWSGDVGRYGMPLNPDPTPPPNDVDWVVVESTYGDRDHPRVEALDGFRPLLEEMLRRQSVMLVPAFAIGRAQQIIYLARELIVNGTLSPFPIYLDSPMAVNATQIYCNYPELHSVEDARMQPDDRCALFGPNVHLVRSVAESKKLNGVRGPALIISSSGMLTGGRVLHHLKRRLRDRDSILALAGYQAAGTRGRALQEGAKTLKIHGERVPVRAHIADLGSLSGHADRSELLRWLEGVERPRTVFVTHGEEKSATAFANELRRRRGWKTAVPDLGDRFELDSGATS